MKEVFFVPESSSVFLSTAPVPWWTGLKQWGHLQFNSLSQRLHVLELPMHPASSPPPETSSWRAKIFHTCPAPARWPGCLPSGQSGLCEATVVLESSSVACWTFVWTALGRLISRALPAAAVDASRVSSFSLLREPQKQERASTPHSAGTK